MADEHALKVILLGDFHIDLAVTDKHAMNLVAAGREQATKDLGLAPWAAVDPGERFDEAVLCHRPAHLFLQPPADDVALRSDGSQPIEQLPGRRINRARAQPCAARSGEVGQERLSLAGRGRAAQQVLEQTIELDEPRQPAMLDVVLDDLLRDMLAVAKANGPESIGLDLVGVEQHPIAVEEPWLNG